MGRFPLHISNEFSQVRKIGKSVYSEKTLTCVVMMDSFIVHNETDENPSHYQKKSALHIVGLILSFFETPEDFYAGPTSATSAQGRLGGIQQGSYVGRLGEIRYGSYMGRLKYELARMNMTGQFVWSMVSMVCFAVTGFVMYMTNLGDMYHLTAICICILLCQYAVYLTIQSTVTGQFRRDIDQ